MLKHIVSNWSHHILQIVVMLVLSPIMLGQLGEDGVGAWFAIIAGTTFIELLAMGVPMASVRHISEAVGAGDLARTNRMISTGFGITIGLGVIGVVLGLAVFLPLFERELLEDEKWQDTAPALLESAKIAFLITAVRVAASVSLRFPIAIFHAKQDFATNNMIQNAGVLFRAISVIAMLYTSPSLTGLAWIFVVEAIGVFLGFRYFIERRFEGLTLGLKHFERGHIRELLGFGLIAAVLNVGTMIAYGIDALVIGKLIGAEEIAHFDFGNKFFAPLASLMYGIGAVVMPAATHLKRSEGTQPLRDAFLKWSKISLSLILPICLYLAVLGPRFLAAWLGKPDYEFSAGLVTVVLVPSFILSLPLRAVALPILLGTSHPARAAIFYLLLALMNLGLSILFVNAGYGIIGVALGTAIPQAIFAVYLLLVTCAELEMSPWKWILYVGGRASIGAIPVLLFLLWLQLSVGVRNMPALILSGIAMLLLFGLTWVLFVYRRDPHLDLHAELTSRLRSSTSDS